MSRWVDQWMAAQGLSWSGLLKVVDETPAPQILVVGDLMLDRYTYGTAERVSPEGPIVVLRAERQEDRLGGAANVACMAAALGARVRCVGIVGNDEAGQRIVELSRQANIDLQAISVSDRPTTCKNRFVGQAAGHGWQQMLRVDHEQVGTLPDHVQDQLSQLVVGVSSDCQGILISDYGKGTCSPRLLAHLYAVARRCSIPVIVDPNRQADFGVYRGATLLKPNRSQAAAAIRATLTSVPQAVESAKQLADWLELEAAVITLDRDGLVWHDRCHGSSGHTPAMVREVCDITGAGDAVLAALGVFYCGGVPLRVAAILANIVAGCEVEHFGVWPVTREELRRHALSYLVPREKIVTVEHARQLAETYRRQNKRIVFTNGCYDLLHAGHVMSLSAAAREGDVLFVGVNSDRSVRKLKGPQRPIIGQYDRLAVIAALQCVDHVILFDDDTPHALLHAIRPDVLVKGGTYRPEEVVGREVVEAYGGTVRVTPVIEGLSTTKILETIIARSAA